jgi:hypothetical protein
MIEKQCTDPYVLYAIGVVLMLENKHKEAKSYLEQAVAGFQQIPYAKSVVWTAPLRLAGLYQQQGGTSATHIKELIDLGITWFSVGVSEAKLQIENSG